MINHLYPGTLVLQDGSSFSGRLFGSPRPVTGEVVFNTGMVGYTEALTDPSYRGQVLVLTYPLIGNYGVPDNEGGGAAFESGRIQVAGLVVSEACDAPSHWNASTSLARWLLREGIPALASVDTRALTKHLRQYGVMVGSIGTGDNIAPIPSANSLELVSEVTVSRPIDYPGGAKKVILVDCGCKESILRNLLERGLTVKRVPYDYNFLDEPFDGVIISNGPGDPKACAITISRVRTLFERNVPILGICLGSQILALAAGGDTFKLRFGHRGQNQPCIAAGTKRCYITSQNHGYAVNPATLPSDWEESFVNANDGTNEGIRHRDKPFFGVQFHPEAAPGPSDTNFLFDQYYLQLNH